MRWTHLSIHGRAFVGMDDENVFAMGTPVDSWWDFRRTGSFFFFMDAPVDSWWDFGRNE